MHGVHRRKRLVGDCHTRLVPPESASCLAGWLNGEEREYMHARTRGTARAGRPRRLPAHVACMDRVPSLSL
eukprot:1985901-Prymnesium_polylepis.2